ncbi:MAG: YggT family protein [Clostridium sp.]|nr:YggT family protein [Clostridium sp.]
MSIAEIVNNLFNLYFWVIVVRIFLTWIPSINWYSQPFRFLAVVSDIVLEPFRRIIPALGGLDFSPIIALLFLQFVQFAVVRMLLILGL